MSYEHEQKLKVTIMVLSFLLALSITLLASLIAYNHYHTNLPATAICPDNIITTTVEPSLEGGSA